MLKRIKAIIAKVKHYFSHANCYNQMEAAGIAVFGMCSGLSGGDKNSGYLQYQCIDCPCFVDIKKGGANCEDCGAKMEGCKNE